MSAPVETLISHAWDWYDQDRTCEYAADLRQAIWTLEEATDLGTDNLNALGREVLQTLAIATEDEVSELLAPMPSVASWLGLDQ